MADMWEYWEEDKAMGELLDKYDELRDNVVKAAELWANGEDNRESELYKAVVEYIEFGNKHHFRARS